jgi:hypothetical protein
MERKLGKKAARHAVAFKFTDFFDPSKLPTPPAVFGHYHKVPKFYPLGNNDFGDCVWAGAAHEHQVWSLAGGWERPRFTTHDVLSDYSAVTGFDKAKPDTDQGTDMQAAASYRRKVGVIDATGLRHQIDSYIALQVGNAEQMILAMWLMGAAGIGVQLPSYAMDDFDAGKPWEVKAKPRIIGGHYIPGVGRDKDGNIVFVSWGKVASMTPEFYERFSDEALAYVSLEILNAKRLSPDGFDADGLRRALQNLKG